MKPEIIALGVNLTILLVHLIRWEEPGKILYWLGACILTAGLLLMKG